MRAFPASFGVQQYGCWALASLAVAELLQELALGYHQARGSSLAVAEPLQELALGQGGYHQARGASLAVAELLQELALG